MSNGKRPGEARKHRAASNDDVFVPPFDAAKALKRRDIGSLAWFDLRHYAGTRTWSAEQWFRAISGRQAIALCLESPLSDASEVLSHFEQIAANPVGTNGIVLGDTGRTNALFLSTEEADSLSYVSPVLETNPNEAEHYWLRRPDADERALLIVDLAAPDDALKQAFAGWLARERAQTGRVGGVSAADMRAWADSEALAYVDLQLHQQATGERFTQQEIAEALFPSAAADRDKAPDPVDRLRKVTAVHARRLLTKALRHRLAAQIGADRAGSV